MRNYTYPLAGSHILLTTLSTTSFPPSFKAFITLLLCWIQYAPHCHFTTSPKTAEPLLRSSSTIPSFADTSRVSKACCKIVGTKASLTQSHCMKNTYLDNERPGFMTCKGGPFAFQRFLDTRKEACISDKWNTREKRAY